MEHQYTFTNKEYGDLVSEYDGLETAYHQHDAIGTTDALLDDNETATDRYQHRAFGVQESHTGTSDTPFTFVGRKNYYRDQELDLYLAGARYYDPRTGRWISKDPIGLDGGDANLYRYVGNDPVNAVDPSGMEPDTPEARGETALALARKIYETRDDILEKAERIRQLRWRFKQPYYRHRHRILERTATEIEELESQVKNEHQKLQSYSSELFGGRYEQARIERYVAPTPDRQILVAGELINSYSGTIGPEAALHRAALERVQGVGLRDVTVEDFLVLYGPVAGIVGGLRRFGPNAVKTLAKRGTQSVDEAAGAASNSKGLVDDVVAESVGLVREAGFFDDLATAATRNADSTKLVLGKWSTTGQSYQNVAAHYKATYFKLDNWRELSKTLSDAELWKINEAFLRQQIKQGKQIILSHDPTKATGFFKNEVDFLRSFYRFEKDGWVWKAIPK